MDFIIQLALLGAAIWVLVKLFGEELAGMIFIWVTIIIPTVGGVIGFLSIL